MSTIIPKQYASCVTEKVCHATLQMAFFPRTIFLFRDQNRRNISPRGNGSVSGYQTTFSDESLFNGNGKKSRNQNIQKFRKSFLL